MLTIIYSLIVSTAILSGRFYLYVQNYTLKRIRLPKMTITISAILLFCYILQTFYPQLLFIFERNMQLILKGQIWRIFTSLFFQDGGISGATFNILVLLFVGGIAEQFLTKKTILTLFLLGGILANCIALFLQQVGAGNSIANFSLIGAILFTTFSKSKNRVVRSFDILGFLCALLLIFLQDIHGAAVIIGAVICSIAFRISKKRGD